MELMTHIEAWQEREARPYRAHLLHLLTIAHADEAGVWEPATKVGLRRALAHRGVDEAKHADVFRAVAQLLAQGALRSDSTEARLILSGSSTTTEENNR